MKIELLSIPRRRLDKVRCCRKTDSHGSYPFESSHGQCARTAIFRIDGLPMCRQHSGDAALFYAINGSISGIEYVDTTTRVKL